MKLRCEELEELAFEKEKTIALHVEKLGSKDSEAHKELSILQEQILLKEKEIGELKEQAKSHEKQVWEVRRDRDTFEDQIKDFQLQVQQLKQNRETQIQGVERDLQAKISYIMTLESQVQTHEKEIKKLKDINILISQEKVTLAKLNQDLTNKVDDLTKKLAAAEKEI